MNVIRRLTTATVVALSIVAGFLLAAATASASRPPPDTDFGNPAPIAPISTPTSTIVSSGSPWWAFVLVAVAAVACTVLVTLFISRLRHARSMHALAH